LFESTNKQKEKKRKEKKRKESCSRREINSLFSVLLLTFQVKEEKTSFSKEERKEKKRKESTFLCVEMTFLFSFFHFCAKKSKQRKKRKEKKVRLPRSVSFVCLFV
jgi:hypothetical protein